MSDIPPSGFDNPSPSPLPSTDDLLGPAKLPSTDEILGPQRTSTSPIALGGADFDEYFSQGSMGHILDAVGQGAKSGWGTQPLGLDDETGAALKKAGVFPDYEKGRATLAQQFNESVMRPAAMAVDLLMRRAPSMAHDILVDLPGDLGGPLAAAMEAFPAGHMTGFPAAIPLRAPGVARAPIEPPSLAEGVPAEAEVAAAPAPPPPTEAATVSAEVAREVPNAEPSAPAPDLDQVARRMAPDVFGEYDDLTTRRDTYRRWIDDLAETRQQNAEAAAPHGPEIADLERRLESANQRMTKIYQARLDPLIAERDEFIADATSRDSPDITRVREQLLQNDYRLRDLAPHVSAAYREAREIVPENVAAAPAPEVAPEAAEQPAVAAETVPGPVVAPAIEPAAPAPAAAAPVEPISAPVEPVDSPAGPGAAPAAPAQAVEPVASPPAPAAAPARASIPDIAGDVSQKLVAAGRPLEEADAAAAIVAAHYEARSASLTGTTPGQLYADEGAAIVGPRAGARTRELELAQKGDDREPAQPGGPDSTNTLEQEKRGAITLADSRATIRLFANADASTFIHESGHQWLEELLRDAVDERATPGVRADAATVRQWLGAVDDAPITRGQHEKFARGFERYMMEGRAPTRALAQVFAQFKNWLTGIYQTVQKLRAPITDDIRAVFDRMLSEGPERTIIAPEAEAPKGLADTHETLAETTPPEHAADIAEQVRGELLDTAQQLPGVHDEIRDPAPGREADGSSPADLAVDRDAATPGSDAGPSEIPARPGAVLAGGSEAAAEGDRAPARPVKPTAKPAPLYEKIPKAPMRLAAYLARAGGLIDEGGDLRATLGDAKTRPGLINNRTGLALDDAALMAWEDGYFPELGTERPTINQLLEALRDDLTGTARYSAHDAARVNEFQDAIARNAQIDVLADRLGIDTTGMSNAQFWDAAVDKLSAEDALKAQDELAEAHLADFAEAERRAKEWVEAQGDAWEPEQFYDLSETRSLEDLEREHRQRDAAAGPGPVARGAEPAGPAGGDQGALQESGGQRGVGAGAAGRDAAEAAGAERPAQPVVPGSDATEPFVEPASGLIDRAGNIRLDKLNQPDHIDQVIRDAAARNSDFLPERRGVITDGEALDLADAIGKDPAFLDTKKIGEAFNEEEIIAAKRLLIQSSLAVHESMKAAAEGSDAEIMALASAIARHEMIQGKVAQATAEWGRAGRAFRMIMEGSAEAADLSQFLKDNTGRTLFQLREMAQYGSRLRTPGQVSRFVGDTAGGRIKQAIIYYYVNALISGPITHARYAVGNAVNALWTPLVQIPVAAAYGAGREALGIEGRVPLSPGALDLGTAPADRIYLGEAGAQLYALGKGSRDGFAAAAEAWRSGQSPPLPGERVFEHQAPPIPGAIGTAIGLPGRSVSAIHSFFKSVRYEQNIAGQAYRIATREGLDGAAHELRVAELSQKPSEAMMAEATKSALKELYMAPTDYHSAMGALTRAVDRSLPAKIVMPFLKVGSQITRQGFIESTPLGLASSQVRGNLALRQGGAAFDMQAAKITTGVGLIGATVLMAAEGNATGDGPTDPAQRSIWLLNHQPNHVTIGPLSIPYQGLGQLGMLMRFSANMYETAHFWDGDDGGKLAVSFFEGITKSVLDDNFMRGLKDMLDAVYHPAEFGVQYLRSFATNWLPYSVGMSQLARVADPYQREIRPVNSIWDEPGAIFDAARAKMPFFSMGLFPRRDRFGEPLPSGGAGDRYANDPVVKAMEDLQTGIGPLHKKIDFDGQNVGLTAQQYDDYARVAGRMTKLQLDAVAGMLANPAVPAHIRIGMIHKEVESARKSASALIAVQSLGTADSIPKAAADAKAAALAVR